LVRTGGVGGLGAVARADPIIRHKTGSHHSRRCRNPAIANRLRRPGLIPTIGAPARDKLQIVCKTGGPTKRLHRRKHAGGYPMNNGPRLGLRSPKRSFSELSPRVERQTYAKCFLPGCALCTF
jgi:hypothetical protein